MSQIPIALQLYTVREDLAADFIGTLRKVAEIGYAGVELAGTGGLSAKELKAVLDDLGLGRAGSHIGLEEMEKNLDAVIDFNLELGNPYLVCPSAPADRRGDAEGWRALGKTFTAIAEKVQPQGLKVCYHNHSFEFQRFEGEYGLDIFYAAADADLVRAEIDTYWVQHGGEDPAAYIRRYPGRCTLVHLKDMTPGDNPTFTEVGAGILDFSAIFDACEGGGGTEWYIVEQDTCARPPLESARVSLENLRKMGKA